MTQKSDDLIIFISQQQSTCSECGEDLGNHAWITLRKDKGALCLSCADLDHLVFLPPGNAVLTRRSRKLSTLSAVVLEWSRSRKRYERQGLMVEEKALHAAEIECLQDSEARERRRLRQAEKRKILDQEYVMRFAHRVRELFPLCPEGREMDIAEFACQKYSGRIGRTAAAKELHETAVRLAVTAHIRHQETNYDQLLAIGYDRDDARTFVFNKVQAVLFQWKAIPVNEEVK